MKRKPSGWRLVLVVARMLLACLALGALLGVAMTGARLLSERLVASPIRSVLTPVLGVVTFVAWMRLSAYVLFRK